MGAEASRSAGVAAVRQPVRSNPVACPNTTPDGALRRRPDADYAALDAQMTQVSASLQRDGLKPGDVISVCAASTARYALVFLAALRAGVVIGPAGAVVNRGSLRAMLRDADASAVS